MTDDICPICDRSFRNMVCEGLIERFLANVQPVASTECWPYGGTVLGSGYGQIGHGKRLRWQAHRLAWTIAHGEIPEGMTIDHVRARGCVRTDCVNLAHLEVVTMQENLRRSDAWSAVNSRKTTCSRGHEYDQVGRRSDGRTYRRCGRCHRAWYLARHARPEVSA